MKNENTKGPKKIPNLSSTDITQSVSRFELETIAHEFL